MKDVLTHPHTAHGGDGTAEEEEFNEVSEGEGLPQGSEDIPHKYCRCCCVCVWGIRRKQGILCRKRRCVRRKAGSVDECGESVCVLCAQESAEKEEKEQHACGVCLCWAFILLRVVWECV